MLQIQSQIGADQSYAAKKFNEILHYFVVQNQLTFLTCFHQNLGLG